RFSRDWSSDVCSSDLQKQETIQLILTTHSPNLASKLKLENLIICNNVNAFPMGEEYTKLRSDSYKFLEKFLDTTKANLFFAKGRSEERRVGKEYRARG